MALTIGKVAERTGVGVETVRFYQRKGLVQQPRRKGGGFRHYDDDVIRRIRFIKRAQEVGFTLTEIGELLNLRVETNRPCKQVKQYAENKIDDIRQKIASLKRMECALEKLTAVCRGREPGGACPILEYFEFNTETC